MGFLDPVLFCAQQHNLTSYPAKQNKEEQAALDKQSQDGAGQLTPYTQKDKGMDVASRLEQFAHTLATEHLPSPSKALKDNAEAIQGESSTTATEGEGWECGSLGSSTSRRAVMLETGACCPKHSAQPEPDTEPTLWGVFLAVQNCNTTLVNLS